MRFEARTITPKEAKSILQNNNKNNRPIRSRHVEAIASDILSGNFEYNHQPIAFDINGVLIDGQHRLAACVRADKPIKIVIAYDVDTVGLATVDRGRPRDVSESLEYTGYAISKTRVALCGILAMLDSATLVHKTRGNNTVNNIKKTYDKYKSTIDMFTKEVNLPADLRRFLAPLVFVLYKQPANTAKILEFFEQLKTGTNLTNETPAYHLREWLKSTHYATLKDEGVFRIFYALSKHLKGEKSKLCLQMSRDAILREFYPELA